MNKWVGTMMITGILAVLAGCNLVTVEETELHELDAETIEVLHIHQDQGEMTITGVEGLQHIEVEATFSVVSEEDERGTAFLHDNLSLEVVQVDSKTAQINTSTKQGTAVEQGYVHLVIRVPNHIAIELKHNEGPLQVEQMNSDLTIQHGTHDLMIDQVVGNITITDGAGKVLLNDINGDVTINNASGESNITHSNGTLSVINGSGAIQVEDFEGNVTARSGSGNIDIKAITGDVTVFENQEGTVQIENVTGTVSLQ